METTNNLKIGTGTARLLKDMGYGREPWGRSLTLRTYIGPRPIYTHSREASYSLEQAKIQYRHQTNAAGGVAAEGGIEGPSGEA